MIIARLGLPLFMGFLGRAGFWRGPFYQSDAPGSPARWVAMRRLPDQQRF
jgi:hypothetical protein